MIEHNMNLLIPIIVILFVPLILLWLLFSHKRSYRLPPGPRGLPLLDNIHDLPSPGTSEYLHWLKHKDLYGPISSVTVLGQSIILLNDKNIALELLEKRSSIHSGRPDLKFAFDMCDWSEPIGQLPNGDRHLFYRKYVYKQLGSKTAISKYN